MQQIRIVVIIVLAILITSFSLPIINISFKNSEAFVPIFQEQDSINSKIKDAKDDTKLVALYKTIIVPEVQNYHDILSAEVNKVSKDKNGNNLLLLTIDLAGDANKNEKYETVYLWFINYNDGLNDKDQQKSYTVIIPNFAVDSNFKNKHGWYLAIFNNTNNSYTLPLSKISEMPKNKVQVFIDSDFIGNPPSFNYLVSVMIRVNSTFLNKPPDYLVDSIPDNNELFWIRQWFS